MEQYRNVRWRVVSAEGARVAESGGATKPPLIVRSRVFMGPGGPAGRIDVYGSLRGTVRRSLLAAALMWSLGTVLFLILRRAVNRAVLGAEERLQVSEEKYRQLFETESDAIVIFDVKERRFIDANEAALAMYGYEREDFLRLGLLDVSAEPENASLAVRKIMKRELSHIPLWYQKKRDGTLFPTETSVSHYRLKGTDPAGFHKP